MDSHQIGNLEAILMSVSISDLNSDITYTTEQDKHQFQCQSSVPA